MSKLWRAASAVALLSALMLAGCIPTTPATSPRAAPASLMVQISSLAPAYTPATLAAWIEQSCGATPAHDLVLQDIADREGRLATAYLDAIVPFLPGGTRPCFKRVFVGTVDLGWTGPGSKYVEGVQDSAFRARHLALSKSVATAFVARYPGVPINWYLTYEANLNDLFYPAVESAYRSLLTAEMQALSSIRPTASFAWSPAFWYPYSVHSTNVAGMTQLRTMLSSFFSSLQSTTAGIRLLALQDFVPGSSCQPLANRMTPSDAVSWIGFLTGLRRVPEVTINVEQYAIDCATSAIRAGDPTELAARETFYVQKGVRLGPSFEIRYWSRTHGLT